MLWFTGLSGAGKSTSACGRRTIASAVLDAILEEDKYARVACETMVKTGVAIVSGEISTTSWIDLEDLVRSVINDIGYTSSDVGYDGDTCGVINI